MTERREWWRVECLAESGSWVPCTDSPSLVREGAVSLAKVLASRGWKVRLVHGVEEVVPVEG